MQLKCNWNTCFMHMKWILNAPECILNTWIKRCVCNWDAILKYMQCIFYASEIHFETFSIHAETIVMHFKFKLIAFEMHLDVIPNAPDMHVNYTRIQVKYIWNRVHSFRMHRDCIWNAPYIHLIEFVMYFECT